MTTLVCLLLASAAPLGAQRANPKDDGRIHLGVSVLLDEQLSLIRNRKILVVVDELARDERGRPTRELLEKDKRAVAARIRIGGVLVAPSRPATGDSARFVAALDSMLPQVNGVVVDLVDHGSRSGHVPRALLAVLRAAARGSVPVFLLDRPNPTSGEHAEGPSADSVGAAADGVYGIPQRHGMTTGEMAKWFNSAGTLGANLTVVPVRGWRRSGWPSDRGIDLARVGGTDVSAEQLMLAATFDLFNATNLSWEFGPGRRVMRVGARWLDARALAKTLGDRLIPGVEFSAGRDPFGGEEQPSLRVEVIARDNTVGLRVVAAIMATVSEAHGNAFQLDVERMAAMTGSRDFGRAIAAGDDSDAVVDRGLPALIDFRRRAKEAYLYR